MLRYFISREFFLTIVGLAVLGVLAYILVFFVFLPSYTRHGEALLVPDVFELSLENAQEALELDGLRYEVRDSAYYPDLAPLTVVSQYPVALSRVKPNRKVYLIVNKQNAPMVKLPDIKELSLYQAKARLESWKLGVGTVIRIPAIEENVVLGVRIDGKPIQAGTEIAQGSKIDLEVGAGFGRVSLISVPDLEGMTYDMAVNRIRGRRLNIGSIIYNPGAPEEEWGSIYNQRPRAGDSIRIGKPVDLFISGPQPEDTEGVDIEVIKS